MNWEELPLQDVPVERLVWPCHDINPDHFHPRGIPGTDKPLHAEELVTGHLFIHDGRHRAIRAILAGKTTIQARVLTHRGQARGAWE